MTKTPKTPSRRPDGRLSNLVLEGGRRKRYVTRDEHGRFVAEDARDSRAATRDGESLPPSGKRKGT